MFAVTPPELDASRSMLAELVGIQRDIADELGLQYHVLDMPPNDLGAPGMKKKERKKAREKARKERKKEKKRKKGDFGETRSTRMKRVIKC